MNLRFWKATEKLIKNNSSDFWAVLFINWSVPSSFLVGAFLFFGRLSGLWSAIFESFGLKSQFLHPHENSIFGFAKSGKIREMLKIV